MWLTWANGLTAVRLAGVVPAAWAVCTGRWWLAAAIFAVAVVTDLADGPVARRFNHATPGGGLFDHSTDALFVATVLAALAATGYVNVFLPVLVVLAFLQYVLDSRALAGAVLRTSLIGRYNGIAYYVLAGIPIVREAAGLGWPPDPWVAALGWLLVLTTVASMADRGLAVLRRVSR